MSENRDNHGFSVLVAQEIGVNRAIMLQHFKHLQIAFLDKEKSAKDVWVKRSRRALSETYPYFTEKEIRGCLDRLERDEYIRAKVDNALNYDRTKSYQLDKKGWDLMGDPASDKRANRKEKASDKRANGFDERADDNITKGPMNIGSCNSVVTSFVEGERTPPAPNPSTPKEEKKEMGLVAPAENPETVKAEIPPSPNSAPPPSPLKLGFCGNCMGLGYRNGRNRRETCEDCEGSGHGDQKLEAANFDVTAIASPSELPGVTLVVAAPGFSEFERDAVKENREVWAKIAPLPRVSTTIEAEAKISEWIAGEGLETVKYRYSTAKEKFDPAQAPAIAAHYCSVYTKNPANKERLLKDPVTHFSDGLFSYLKNEQAFGRNLLPDGPKDGGATRQQPGKSRLNGWGGEQAAQNTPQAF